MPPAGLGGVVGKTCTPKNLRHGARPSLIFRGKGGDIYHCRYLQIFSIIFSFPSLPPKREKIESLIKKPAYT
jgi:hypothetical protein